MGGGGKSDSQTVGYKYFAGVHAVLCHGVLDKITRLTHDKRIAWSGAAVGGETITVDAPELFGGESREGGVAGDIDILDGKPTQGLNAYLVSKLGSSIPAFRGVVSLIFKGYYWGNNPYLKGFAARAQRIHKKSDGSAQWYDTKAEILVEKYFIEDTSSIPNAWSFVSIAHSGGVFAAVASGGTPNSVYISTNGYDWIKAIDIGNFYASMPRVYAIHSASVFVCVFQRGFDTLHVYSIDNGQTWTVGATIASPLSASAIDFAWSESLGKGVLIRSDAATSQFRITADGFPTQAGAPFPTTTYVDFASNMFRLVEYVPAWGMFVAIGKSIFKTSVDGVVWSTNSTLPASHVWTSCSVSPQGVLVAACYDGGYVGILVTSDGVTWKYTKTSYIADGSYVGVTYAPFPGGFFIGATAGSNLYSVDGETWTVRTEFTYKVGSGATSYELGMTVLGMSPGTSTTVRTVVIPFDVTQDMNPAHIIRECLTDPLWGMGYPEADVDYISFIQAADTLFSEQMGISLLWETSMKIESFILEILRHIDGTLYIEPTTGLYTLKLIRDDYDENSLLVLDEDNIDKIEAFSRPLPGELINSVTVTYWDKATGENASVTVQDPALVQQQGAVIATTVDYPGFTNQDIAVRVANRDLISLSSELASCTIYTGIDAKGLRPGDAFKLNYPEYEANDLVMRVTEISYGDGRSNMIRIKAVEDVFSTPSFAVVADQESEWVDPATIQPEPLDTRVIGESPYYELVRVMGQRTADDEINYNPDIGYLLASAPRPSGSELNALVYVDVGTGYKKTSVFDFCPACSLVNPVGRLDTVWEISGGVDISDAMSGRIAQIGTELIQIESISGTLDEIVVKRGVLDSVVQEHSAGSAVVVWDGYLATDTTQYLNNETIDVKVKTTTGSNVLPLGSAPVDQVTFAGRAYRPYPPGNLKINGEYEPADTVEGDIEVTWAHRDRLQQTSGDLVDFFGVDVGPEDGTTYTVELYDNVAHTLLYSEDSIVGNSVIILQDSFESPPDLRVDETNEQRVTEDNEDRLTEIPQYEIRLEIYAVRAGVRSLYKQKVAFNWMYLEES